MNLSAVPFFFRNAVLEHDEGEDFILDIVEDVCTSALDIIFANYIQRQLVPYTVLQAKDAIVQIIEVRQPT